MSCFECTIHFTFLNFLAFLFRNNPRPLFQLLSVCQENVGSACERTKMGSGSSKDGVKSSEITKSSPDSKITTKAKSSLVLGKNSTHKTGNGNNSIHVSSPGQLTESCSGSTVRRTSLARKRFVTSSPIGRINQQYTNSSGRDFGDENNFRRSPPGYRQTTQVETIQI